MLNLLQRFKRVISICLITLLTVTSVLTISPAPAMADNNLIKNISIVNCEGDNCGNMASFAAGVVSGSAVTLAATGDAGMVAAIGTAVGQVAGTLATVGQAAATVAAPAAAFGSAVISSPIVVPAAATAAVGYGAYRLWKGTHQSQS